jgi:hypothetical protein
MPLQDTDISATDRLVALMDHLGLGSAYFGTAIPRDISGLATASIPLRFPTSPSGF